MVLGRDDDVINVAGHRLSTAAIEEVLLSHHDVSDAAVIATPDVIKGHVPVAIIINNSGKCEITRLNWKETYFLRFPR